MQDRRNIYYMEAEVRYKKGKTTHRHDAWIVTVYDTPSEIMAYDKVAMGRISEEIYGKTFKGDRHILIKRILTKKVVGKENELQNG
jgi:hypothetical protein